MFRVSHLCYGQRISTIQHGLILILRKEPKLFTIYFLNAEGEVLRELSPLHDATMGKHEAMFDLLEQYLTALPLEKAERIVFCGDGAPWIWSDAIDLCKRMHLDMTKVHQVLDYTHAKQQLGQSHKISTRTKSCFGDWLKAIGSETGVLFSGIALGKLLNYVGKQ